MRQSNCDPGDRLTRSNTANPITALVSSVHNRHPGHSLTVSGTENPITATHLESDIRGLVIALSTQVIFSPEKVQARSFELLGKQQLKLNPCM
jgi:hypothetical protein